MKRGSTGRPTGPLVLLAITLLLAGCQTQPSQPIGFSGARLSVDDPRAEKVLVDYLAALDGRSGLRGSARVSLTGPDFKLNRPQRIVVERPDRLRFEVLGLFDQLAAVLVSDGRRYGFFDASTGEIARGFVSPSLLWDLAKIDLAPEEAVGLLLGTPQPAPGLARAGVWLEAEGRIVVAFAWPQVDPLPTCEGDSERGILDVACFVDEAALADGGEVFFFDGGGRLAEVRSMLEGGEIRFRAVFEDYASLEGSEGTTFPNRVTIESPAVESSARFVWKRVMLADDLSDRLFTLPETRSRGRGAQQGG